MGSSGGSGGGGSGGGTSVNYIRYAPYLETKHKAFLDQVSKYRGSLISKSPFSTFSAYDIDDAFFGAGVAITSFTSVYDMFEDFMSDFDIDTKYDTVFSNTVNSQNVKDLVVAEGQLLNDELEDESLPRILLGARNINSVNSSTFIISRELIEEKRLKLLSKFSAELKYNLIPVAADRWKTILEWRKNVVNVYNEIAKLYFSAKMDMTTQNYEMLVKDKLWAFTVLDYERAALGSMQGARSSETIGGEGPSGGQKIIGGALSGAASGAMIGAQTGMVTGPVGAGIGAALGGLSGLF